MQKSRFFVLHCCLIGQALFQTLTRKLYEIQLIAARTEQEYNLRNQRKGSFWYDRYPATVIEKNHPTKTIENEN
jgi:hypothetical protein